MRRIIQIPSFQRNLSQPIQWYSDPICTTKFTSHSERLLKGQLRGLRFPHHVVQKSKVAEQCHFIGTIFSRMSNVKRLLIALLCFLQVSSHKCNHSYAV